MHKSKTWQLRILPLAFLAFTLMLLGCAGSTNSTSQAVETSKVEMPPSYRFDPPVIRVHAGTTVTWHNGDNFTHSVLFSKGGFPFLNLRPGESGQITFSTAGEYAYECSYHSHDMQGKVIVVP